MKILISTIMEKYAVVVVCAAGHDAREVDSLPSSFSPKLPLIVVGGVDPDTGERTTDSNFGLARFFARLLGTGQIGPSRGHHTLHLPLLEFSRLSRTWAQCCDKRPG